MHLDLATTTAHLRSLSDAELTELYVSGKLADEAAELARAELSQRHLALPEIPAAAQIDDLGEFLTLRTCLEPTDGHVLASCLRAHGIPTLVADANTVQATMLLGLALGGVRVQVPAELMPAALELLQRFDRGELSVHDAQLPE